MTLQKVRNSRDTMLLRSTDMGLSNAFSICNVILRIWIFTSITSSGLTTEMGADIVGIVLELAISILFESRYFGIDNVGAQKYR